MELLYFKGWEYLYSTKTVSSFAASFLHLNCSDWCWKRRSCKGKKKEKKKTKNTCTLTFLWKLFSEPTTMGFRCLIAWSTRGCPLKILQKPQASFPLVSVLLSKKKKKKKKLVRMKRMISNCFILYSGKVKKILEVKAQNPLTSDTKKVFGSQSF